MLEEGTKVAADPLPFSKGNKSIVFVVTAIFPL